MTHLIRSLAVVLFLAAASFAQVQGFGEGTGGDFILETSRNGQPFDQNDGFLCPGDAIDIRMSSPGGTLAGQTFSLLADINPVSAPLNRFGGFGLSDSFGIVVPGLLDPNGTPLPPGGSVFSGVIPSTPIWNDGGIFFPGGANDLALVLQAIVANPAGNFFGFAELSNTTVHEVLESPDAGSGFSDNVVEAILSRGFSDADLGTSLPVNTTLFTNTLETTGLVGHGTQYAFGIVGPGQGFGESNGPAADAIVKFKASTAGAYTFSLCNSNFDTRIWLQTLPPNPVGLVHNDDAPFGTCPLTLRSRIKDYCLDAGEEVLIVIDGFNASHGLADLVITKLDFFLESVTPATGSTLGGDLVTITGCGLDLVDTVLFGQTPAQSITVIDTRTIQVVAPPHPQGVVNITVSDPTNSAVLGQAFTYVTPGVITTSYKLADDGVRQHVLSVPVVFGNQVHNSMFIAANGVVTFNSGTTRSGESMLDLFSGWSGVPSIPGAPGVAVMYGDMNRGGIFSGATYDVVEDPANLTVEVSFTNQVHWQSQAPAGTVVCTFGAQGPNSVRLDYTGYLPGPSAADGIVIGITNGIGFIGQNTDFTPPGMTGDGIANALPYMTPGPGPESFGELIPGGVPVGFNVLNCLDPTGSFQWILN